jgi:hypothetical protein
LTNQITDSILLCWKAGRKTKQTPSGWISGNAPCCIHNGEKEDNRGRGGILLANDGFLWHCFNCNFKAGWQPGKLLSKNTKDLYAWLGMSADDIRKLGLVALKLKDNQPVTKQELNFELTETELPADTLSIDEWINAGCQDVEFIEVIDYIIGNEPDKRGMTLDMYNWHWSAAAGYKDRVIIPFYHNKKIVGYTGRKIRSGKPKYLTDAQPSYVFNIDAQLLSRSYVIVVEGQFDAIAIEGVAVMGNTPNAAQIARINALGKEIIVVPDRDKAGLNLIDIALANKWSVSSPLWDENIKDVADAVKQYGKLYTLFSILFYKESNDLKIQILRKKLANNE